MTLLHADAESQTSLVEAQPHTGRTHQIRIHLAALGHPIANDRLYGGTWGWPSALWRSRSSAAAAGPNAEQRMCFRGLGRAAPGGEPNAAACGSPLSGVVGGRADNAEASLRTPAVPSKRTVSEREVKAEETPGEPEVKSPGEPGVKRALANDRPGGDDASAAAQDDRPRQLQDAWPVGAAEVAADAALVPAERRAEGCGHCPYLSPRDYPLDLRPLWLHGARYQCKSWVFEAPAPDWALPGYRPLQER